MLDPPRDIKGVNLSRPPIPSEETSAGESNVCRGGRRRKVLIQHKEHTQDICRSNGFRHKNQSLNSPTPAKKLIFMVFEWFQNKSIIGTNAGGGRG